MSKTVGILIGVFVIAVLSFAADESSRSRDHLSPEQILTTLTPEIPEMRMVTSEDLEPNPQGAYRRHTFIRGDFNRDGIEDMAIAATDEWQKQGTSFHRNGYVLIASKKKDGSWIRVFLHKFRGTTTLFYFWTKTRWPCS